MENKYKLRIYKLTGPKKGDLDHEEFFKTHEDLDKRYKELSRLSDNGRPSPLRPTAWERKGNDWERLLEY